MWLIENNNIMTYSEYLLSESLKPKITDYGTDLINGKWKKLELGFYITHFKTDEYIYSYLIRDGFVGFFASELDSDILNQNSIKDILNNKKVFERKSTINAIRVFNYFFYITLEAISYFKLREIKFDGADKMLGNIYSIMVKNSNFNLELDRVGFSYKGKTNSDGREFYLFTNLQRTNRMLSYKQYLQEKLDTSENITPEMREKFKIRTKQHIDWVIAYGKQIESMFPNYKGLTARCKKHDADKYSKELKTPYIYITWKYIDSSHKIPDNIDITAATTLHYKNNKHHPEYWSDDENVINPKDRDKSYKLVDASKMDDLSIAEMCADWLSVSRERGTNPMKWYEDNVDVRWKFTNNQKKQIVKILSSIWGNEDEEV